MLYKVLERKLGVWPPLPMDMSCRAVPASKCWCFSFVGTVMQWLDPDWAWSRKLSLLDELFPDDGLRYRVISKLLTLPVKQRLEYFRQSKNAIVRMLVALVTSGAQSYCVVHATV